MLRLHLFATLLVLPLLGRHGANQPPEDPPLVIWDVTVIDGTGAPASPHMAVFVQSGRIQAIRPVSARAPGGFRVVDGHGRFLIPGLWDMHVHMSTRPSTPLGDGPRAYQANSRYFLSLFAGFGITGVRDMSGNLGLLTAWRDSVNRGLLIGPRMLVTGNKLGGNLPAVPGAPYPLRTEADVTRAVEMLRAGGADFVKVDNLPRELFPALAEASRRHGLTFVGHVSETMSVAEAVRAGQRSIEHLDAFPLSISDEEASIRRRMSRRDSWWMRALYRVGLNSPDKYSLGTQRRILESWSPERARSLYAELARDSAWQVPTLNGLRATERVAEPWSYAREQTPYLPPPRHRQQDPFWVADTALARRLFTRQLEIVRELNRSGVPLLAGTDTPGFDRIPSFSLAEELSLMVRAGLSPMQALQTATRNPARFLGLEDSLGTVRPGKAADMVLLDADPLLDIRNVHLVHSVVLRGRYLAPATLDSLRASVRGMVTAWRDSVRVTGS
jgi:Amidohydrolase family